jgi:hypothetical protein
MSIDDQRTATMDPQAFARLVKDTDTKELAEFMQGGQRAEILDRIFTDMPGVFQPARARSLATVIHWLVGDRPDGGVDTYELVIADGTCVLSPAPDRRPVVEMSVGAVDFIRMVTGNANPVRLFMLGKLRTKGDLALAMRIPNLFVPPKP